MTDPAEQTPQDEEERASVRKSLALAAKRGIGPFKRRAQNPSSEALPRIRQHFEDVFDIRPENFSLDRATMPRNTNYKGTLKDKPVEIVKTVPLGHRRLTGNEFYIDDEEEPKLHFKNNSIGRKYNCGFQFNRNGMNYVVRFFQPYSDWMPANDFQISDDDNEFSFLKSTRSMTKKEAQYALDIIESELSEEQKIQFIYVLARLKKNLPSYETVEQAEKADHEEAFTKLIGNNKYEAIKKILNMNMKNLSITDSTHPIFYKKSLGSVGSGKSAFLKNHLNNPTPNP